MIGFLQSRLDFWRGELDAENKRIAESIKAMKGSGQDALGKDYWHKQPRIRTMVRTYELALEVIG